jgi:hypothetical protein
MGAHNEMTRYAFISHMEDYMKKLLKDPLTADTDEFMKSHGIDGPKALKMLTARLDPNDENSAVVIKTAKIKDNGSDEDGKRIPDTFTVVYKIPRKDYNKKMRNLFISNFESNIIQECPINEDGEGGAIGGDGATDGANNASASGQFITPLFGKPIKRKTLYITEEQAEYIRKHLDEDSPCVMNTRAGDFGYDAPAFAQKGDPTLDHKDIMKKSWEENNK